MASPGAALADQSLRRKARSIDLPALRRLNARDKLFLAVLSLVAIVGTLLGVAWTSYTDKRLLQETGRHDALLWANQMRDNIDLSQAMRTGALPAGARDLLSVAGNVGHVYRVRVYDAQGRIVASSRSGDVGKITFEAFFSDVIATGRSHVTVMLDMAGSPVGNYAEAYVPVMSGAAFTGAVAVDVDLGPQIALHRQKFRYATFGLVALLLLSAVIAGHIIMHNMLDRERSERSLRLAKDEADTANRTKSEFLANMSHELRTPLNAILGFSEILGQELYGPLGNKKYQEYASDIHESGRHLLDLINDILDLSKVESGATRLDEEIAEVYGLVAAVATLVKERAHRGGVDFVFDLPDELPSLRVDIRKLKQVLVNLLSNAIKFTDPGGRVVLRVWFRHDSGYVFQVNDTGIGIALEDIPRALSPFQQIESRDGRIYEGTGLGLPLSKSLVEMHAGSLDLQSQLGVGTTVTVRLPPDRIVEE